MTENDLTANNFIKKLKTKSVASVATGSQRYFKDTKGDVFIGVRMGNVFALAKEFQEMPIPEIEKLLESEIHEARAGAVSIMDYMARKKNLSEEKRKEYFDLYLKRHDRINNWDLVDRAAMYVVGSYLFNKSRSILYKLAKSKNIWERRTSIVATGYFIRNNDLDDTYKISEMLLNDKEDLIHKATGWMLRYSGDKSKKRLMEFLDKHAATMPRTALRYSIEKFDKKEREHYMKMRKSV